jgi:hypothetical protein
MIFRTHQVCIALKSRDINRTFIVDTSKIEFLSYGVESLN